MRLLLAILIAAPAANCLGQTAQAFDRCVACHAKEGTGDLGPNLHGVVGRKAGSLEDFRYSRAMARSGIVWNEKTLDAFLKAPDQLVPGTRMPFEGIVSDTERAAVIQYLRTLK
ncbi:MAG: c-type cytochrome [Burkholderiales bacterium]